MENENPTPNPPEDLKPFGYSYELQVKIVAMMIFRPELLGKNIFKVRPELFAHPVFASIVKLQTSFFSKYDRMPQVEELEEEIYRHLETFAKPIASEEYLEVFSAVLDAAEYDFRFLSDRVAEFFDYWSWTTAVLEAVGNINKEIKRGKRPDYEKAISKFHAAFDTDGKETAACRVLESVCVADVAEQPLDWLWHNTFPKAQLSLLVGKPGSGKSFFTMMMAARVSSGRGFPSHTEYTVDRGQVLVLQIEDSVASTCKKRLRWEGAHEKNIHFLIGTKDKLGNTYPVDLSTDLVMVRQKMAELGDVKLLIVDPLSAYVGISAKMDSHHDREVRMALSPLITFIEEEKISVIGIMHMNKNQMSGDPIHRIMGSAAWGQLPRVVWVIAKDRQDPDLRHFLIAKNNEVSEAAKKEAEFVFRIQDNHIMLAQDVQPMCVAEAIGPELPEDAKERRGKLKTAITFLEEQQAKGTRELSAKEVNQLHPDINDNTWRQARQKLKIKTFQRLDGWWWVL